MTTHADAKFSIQNWDEKTWDGRNWKEVVGAKLTHAAVTKSYAGDITGQGTSHTLTTYDEHGSAHYVGLEQIIGQLDTKIADGIASFLVETLQHNVDLGAQTAYLTAQLEEHKADLIREIAGSESSK